MALSHKEAIKRKKTDLDEIKEKMSNAKIAIVTDYRGGTKGMTVKAISELRRRLREQKGECRVYKNTLCTIAMKETGAEAMAEYLKEPTALVFGYEDPAAVSKVLVDFLKEQKENQLPIIKAAFMDGQVYKPDQIKVLATLPSKQELLGTLARTMNAPIQGLANVLAGVPRAFVTVLDRIREQKEQA